MGGYLRPAQLAELDLDDFLREQAQALVGTQKPEILYHYTSLQGLRGILNTGVLRASPMDRLNDWAEARFAGSVFRATLDRTYGAEPRGHFYEVLDAMRRDMDLGLNLRNVHTVSFSKNGDDPAMWTLYGHQGQGFSIGVPMEHCLRWASDPPWGQLWRVNYGEEAAARVSRLALAKARELLIADDELSDRAPLDYSTDDEFARAFLAGISPFTVAFKPAVWSDEEEWRWAFIREPDHPAELIELPLTHREHGESVISEIYVGPRCKVQDVKEITTLLNVKAPGCVVRTPILNPS